jgi:hypothetical protein
VFIVLWFILGSLNGIVTGLPLLQDGVMIPCLWNAQNASITIVERRMEAFLQKSSIFVGGIPVIRGFYFVGQMLLQYTGDNVQYNWPGYCPDIARILRISG